jgi:nicotinate-nucleotide adenylyltransferase
MAAARQGGASERRIGLLGGTFDPIHNGHLRVARALRRRLRLQQVWLIPAGTPPHKPRGVIAPARARLQMVRLAVRGDAHLRARDLELKRVGPSYTIETVRALRRRHPGTRFLLLLGADAAAGIRTWHQYRELLGLIDVVVFPRRGAPRPTRAALEQWGFLPGHARVIDVGAPPIAARALRLRLRDGGSLKGLIPPRVADFIARHHLYRPKKGVG